MGVEVGVQERACPMEGAGPTQSSRQSVIISCVFHRLSSLLNSCSAAAGTVDSAGRARWLLIPTNSADRNPPIFIEVGPAPLKISLFKETILPAHPFNETFPFLEILDFRLLIRKSRRQRSHKDYAPENEISDCSIFFIVFFLFVIAMSFAKSSIISRTVC